jgi:hypothetical protein
MKNRQLRARVVRLVLLRHIVHNPTPLKLASVSLLLAWTHLDGEEPVNRLLTHCISETTHEARIPGVLERLCLHDNVGALRTTLHSAQDRPILGHLLFWC